ncbi:MAG: hypothetical protein GXO45_02620 [Aquificae bacterium]|nr:hypothetical protein [Aquificota bacterium]
MDVQFCDDGLVFYHLNNGVVYLLKALAEAFNLSVNTDSITALVDEIQKKTTVKFPDWIHNIIEIEDLSLSDGCAVSVCYDMDMYGDIVESVYALKDFVYKHIS